MWWTIALCHTCHISLRRIPLSCELPLALVSHRRTPLSCEPISLACVTFSLCFCHQIWYESFGLSWLLVVIDADQMSNLLQFMRETSKTLRWMIYEDKLNNFNNYCWISKPATTMLVMIPRANFQVMTERWIPLRVLTVMQLATWICLDNDLQDTSSRKYGAKADFQKSKGRQMWRNSLIGCIFVERVFD